MNKDVKKLWIEALRSGKYTQTTGLLCEINHDTDKRSYCCLGVLCDLMPGLQVTVPDPDVGGIAILFGSEHADADLPDEVQKWAGLESGVGFLNKSVKKLRSVAGKMVPMTTKTLTGANDTLLMTFPEIADIIEAQF